MLEKIVARCKASVTLTVNQNKDYYETRLDYLRRDDDLTDDEIVRLLAAPDLYELQFYPDTPIGSYRVFGISLEDVCQQAIQILDSQTN